MRARFLTPLILAALFAVSPALAEKLKGFYSGSGGMDEAVHRVVLIQFGEDGSALVQQNWIGKPPQTWHARWSQKDDRVTITFAPQPGSRQITPLVLDIKHDSLVPISWDNVLGILGPPTLSPFGEKNVLKHSVASCVGLDSSDASRECVQWDSSKSQQ
jgi:hypothetical protein